MDFDRLLDNRSPMAVRCIPMEDRHGRDVMVVIAKITYAVSPTGAVSLALPSSPVRLSDERTTSERWSSIGYPSDLVDEKPGTDVALLGTAHPPPDVTSMEVSLRIETGQQTLFKAVRVHGKRIWYEGVLGPAPGPPEPLGPTPLVYELAYGGYDESDPNAVTIDRRNPAGMGVVRDRARLSGTPAPPLEDPVATVGSRKPAPACFAPIPASWEPRASRAGTHDAAWRKDRAPVPPADRDPRFNCFAPPELHAEEPLRGDEPVEILGATPEGVWRFRLPSHEATFRSIVRGVEVVHPTHLDSIVIDADRRRVELVWRASFPMPRRVGFLSVIEVGLVPPLPDAMIADLTARVNQQIESEAHGEHEKD